MDHEHYVPTPKDLVPVSGVIIEFPEASPGDAGALARDLKESLDNAALDEGLPRVAEVAKVNPNAQDAGTILSIILAAPATIIVARGIAAWLKSRKAGRIRIRRPDGSSVDITGLDSSDMPKMQKALSPEPRTD